MIVGGFCYCFNVDIKMYVSVNDLIRMSSLDGGLI